MVTRRFPAALLAALLLSSMAPVAGASEPVGTTIEGTLEVEISEQADANGRLTTATYDYTVRDERGKRTKVTFKGEPPAGMAPGAKVRIKGHRSGDSLVVDGDGSVLADAGSTATALDAAGVVADAGSPVTRKLAVILVNFASNPVQPYTASYAAGVLFTNTNSVAAFYAAESYGALTLTGDVSGWHTITYDTSTCDTAAIQSRADAKATAAGVVLSDYTHVTYIFPHLNACSFAGRAQIPGSRSWINTISATSPKIHDWVVAHELGHNFGVHHANSYSCTTGGTRVPLSATAADCSSTEYGDPHTVMGAWNPIAKYPHGHAWHRLQMGFIDTAERRNVTVSGLYTLGSTKYADSATKSLRINRTGSSATRHWFDVEFRQPGTLFDGFAPTAPVVNGATIRLVGDDTVRTQSWLIDTTPATTAFSDAPLGVGKTFTDPLSGIAITTLGMVTDAAGHPAVKIRVLFPNTAPPAAPGGFTATSSNDGLTASLSWSAASTAVGVASYRVYRDDVLVATLAASARTFSDSDRVPGTTYGYRIQAIDWVDLVGASASTTLLMRVPVLGSTTASFAGPAASGADGTTADQGPIPTRATTISFGLRFSAPVTNLTKAKLALSGSATGCAISSLTGSGTDYTVTVTGCSEGTLSAAIDAGAVWDNLGYLAPAVDAASDTLLIDRTAPVTKTPSISLREGARLAGSSLPVRITLGASEGGSGVASFDVARSVDGGAFATLSTATTAPSLDTTLSNGRTYRFRVRTRDHAGNVSGWVEGALLKSGLTQQTSSGITYRGTWSTGNVDSYSGGSARYTKSSTASATYTVTGRGVAIVTTRSTDRGKVKVYIDGDYVRTVDLYRSSVEYRILAFATKFSSRGTHTIKLVGVGTSGRPRVDLDAFAVIR